MITKEEIKKVAQSWWKNILLDYIKSENSFPKRIDRIGKIKAGKVLSQFHQHQQEVDELVQGSITHQKGDMK